MSLVLVLYDKAAGYVIKLSNINSPIDVHVIIAINNRNKNQYVTAVFNFCYYSQPHTPLTIIKMLELFLFKKYAVFLVKISYLKYSTSNTSWLNCMIRGVFKISSMLKIIQNTPSNAFLQNTLLLKKKMEVGNH